MLMLSKDLIPREDKNPPYYIVYTKDKHSNQITHYVENFGVQKFPTYIDDSIIDQSENRCDAIMFCKKEDAEKVARLCTFKCNCGNSHRVGKIAEVTLSGRQKEGVTYGLHKTWDILENKIDYFDVVYDYKELEEEYEADYTNILD